MEYHQPHINPPPRANSIAGPSSQHRFPQQAAAGYPNTQGTHLSYPEFDASPDYPSYIPLRQPKFSSSGGNGTFSPTGNGESMVGGGAEEMEYVNQSLGQHQQEQNGNGGAGNGAAGGGRDDFYMNLMRSPLGGQGNGTMQGFAEKLNNVRAQGSRQLDALRTTQPPYALPSHLQRPNTSSYPSSSHHSTLHSPTFSDHAPSPPTHPSRRVSGTNTPLSHHSYPHHHPHAHLAAQHQRSGTNSPVGPRSLHSPAAEGQHGGSDLMDLGLRLNQVNGGATGSNGIGGGGGGGDDEDLSVLIGLNRHSHTATNLDLLSSSGMGMGLSMGLTAPTPGMVQDGDLDFFDGPYAPAGAAGPTGRGGGGEEGEDLKPVNFSVNPMALEGGQSSVGEEDAAGEDEEPLYVNAKQYHRIVKRRAARARLEEMNRLIRQRKPYLHESRHKHACRRPRGPGGRFLTAPEIEALRLEEEEKARLNGGAGGGV